MVHLPRGSGHLTLLVFPLKKLKLSTRTPLYVHRAHILPSNYLELMYIPGSRRTPVVQIYTITALHANCCHDFLLFIAN